ncbi:hypothetical protein D9M71_383280 [compost metagenome]
MTSTMARLTGSSSMSLTKLPSIFRKSTGKCLRYANDDIPAQKSSNEKRQPKPFNSLMKRMALPRLAIALVSVISKQISSGGMSYWAIFWRRNARNFSSPMLLPDRLIAHMASGPSCPSTIQRRMILNTFSTTQLSRAVIKP